MGWSPEQIAARLTQDKDSASISHEAIYRYICHRSAQKDYWHKLLPRKKHRRGRFGKQGGSSLLYIKDRVSVHKRPTYIQKALSFPRRRESSLAQDAPAELG